MHEYMLPVDARSVVERQAWIADPPAVAVMSVRRVAIGIVTVTERGRAVGDTADGVVDPRGRHDLPAPQPTTLKAQLAEPGGVPEGCADSAVGHGGAVCGHGDLRVQLGARRLPQRGGNELRQRGSGRSLEDPGEHVGEDRAVTERPAVRAV